MFGTASQQQLTLGGVVEFTDPAGRLVTGRLVELACPTWPWAKVALDNLVGMGRTATVAPGDLRPAGTALRAAQAARVIDDPYAQGRAYAERRNAAAHGRRAPSPELAGDPDYAATVDWARRRNGKVAR